MSTPLGGGAADQVDPPLLVRAEQALPDRVLLAGMRVWQRRWGVADIRDPNGGDSDAGPAVGEDLDPVVARIDRIEAAAEPTSEV